MTPTAMARYSAGPWLGLIRGRCLVALPADASEETAGVVWDLLAGRPGVEQLLATVLSGRLDLTGMPAFAIVSFEGEVVHAILRGDVHLRMTGVDHGETRMSGTGVSTWNERRVQGVQSFELLVDDAVPDAENLPIEAGAVRLAAVHADLVVETAEKTEQRPETSHDDRVPLPAVSEPGPLAEPDGDPVPESSPESATGTAPDRATGSDPEPGPEPQGEPAPAAEPAMGTETSAAPDHTSGDEEEAAPGDQADAAAGDQPDGDSDIGMTIAPDAAEFDAVPPSSGETTLVQPAEDEPDDSTIASRPPAAADTAPPRHASAVPGPQELIDSVPWLAAARRAVPDPGQARARDPQDLPEDMAGIPADLGQTVAPETHPDDVADGDTVLSPFAAARAATPAPAPPSGPPSAVPSDPDHDGETVMKSALDLTGVETAAPAPPVAPAPTTGPLVLARLCSEGHANPPTASTCTVCGQSLGGEARQVPRPALGRIRMSTGEVLELDRPAVIGRQPQAHRVGSGTMPRMIQVRSPNGDISRSHCEVVLEGWHVQLRDLKATNGTVLIREGAAPRRLGQGESVMVLDGDIADLGDGVSLRFEAIP